MSSACHGLGKGQEKERGDVGRGVRAECNSVLIPIRMDG